MQNKLEDKGWLFWTLVAIVIKGIILSYFIFQSNTLYSAKMVYGTSLVSNDYNYILRPVDNYFAYGTYTLEPGATGYFAGRMPGLSLPYMLLRFVFEKENALLLLAALQFLLAAFSVYILARTAQLIIDNKMVFLSTFFLFAISTFTGIFDFMVGLSESFSVSTFILFFYFLVKYLKYNSTKDILLSGCFLAWAIFLRPFLGLLIALVPLLLFVSQYKQLHFKKVFTSCFIFIAPFIFADSCWIVNNYLKAKQFIPLEQSASGVYGTIYSPGWLAIRKFILNTGGECAYYETDSEAAWFREELDDATINNYAFPTRIYNNVSYNRDSLLALRNIYRSYRKNASELSAENPEMQQLDKQVVIIANRYTQQFVNGNSPTYLFYKFGKAFKRLVFKSGSSYLTLPSFSSMNLFQKAIKIKYSLLYYLVLIVGSLGLIMLLKDHKKITLFMILFIANLTATIVLFSDIQESRYFITAYPLLLIATVYSLYKLFPGFFKQKPN